MRVEIPDPVVDAVLRRLVGALFEALVEVVADADDGDVGPRLEEARTTLSRSTPPENFQSDA